MPSHRTTRRTALRTLGVALGGAVAGCLSNDDSGTPTSSTDDDTPPTNTDDTSPTTDDDTDVSDPPADARWTADLPGRVGELRFHDGTLYAGTDASSLVALDQSDGRVRWRFDAPNPVKSLASGTGLLVADGTLYAVSGAFDGLHGQENRVHALDPGTGEELWTYAPDISYEAFGLHGTADGALFVGSNDDALSDEGDPTIALETDTGAERWRVGTGDVSGIEPGVETTVVATQFLFRGLATADGTERWSVSVEDAGLLSPRVAGETVYVGHNGGPLRAVALDSGTERWRLDGPVNSVLVDDSGAEAGVFLGGREVRHAGSDGTVRWTTDESLLLALLAGDRLLGFGESAVVSLSPEDGSVDWRATPGGEYTRPAAVAEGVVVTADGQSARLFGLDAASGETRWTFDPGVEQVTDPVVGDGAVFVAEASELGGESESGRVFARDLIG
ncbi:PQQ-binding-like beta-propeller repeat protein [Salinirubrum litoreum]|uniref:PQQ-binding-like beta-propeller repeat protein n=1 Tax=Salinirubrum litoreum TaxID=1126234 RepID=A0ABD5R7Y7_9EURY|nr:PQQ-binding-like beta-propeller repeat protein [Salinirubrum litoreum]